MCIRDRYYGYDNQGTILHPISNIIPQVSALENVVFPNHVMDGSVRLIETGFFEDYVKNFYLGG